VDSFTVAPYHPNMPRPTARIINYEAKPKSNARGREDLAYIAPMATFLIIIWISANSTVKQFLPLAYPTLYVMRTVIVALLLICLWRNYTKIRWNHWWLGILVGVIGIFQWVGMQLWLQKHFAFFAPSPDAFDPTKEFSSPAMLYGFIAIRIIGASLVVPVMEELFWRDFLWRQILAPNDFKLASVGEWGWAPFLGVSVAFAVVHGNWWLTSIVWGLMIAGLLVYTKSLGACIIAHGVTNLLLAVYVLRFRDWAFW
jgi:CAAX prenyl protease-like protein